MALSWEPPSRKSGSADICISTLSAIQHRDLERACGFPNVHFTISRVTWLIGWRKVSSSSATFPLPIITPSQLTAASTLPSRALSETWSCRLSSSAEANLWSHPYRCMDAGPDMGENSGVRGTLSALDNPICDAHSGAHTLVTKRTPVAGELPFLFSFQISQLCASAQNFTIKHST